MVKLIINGEFRSSLISMKVIVYYVSMINVDVNNLEKKIFVNNIISLFVLSLINFNLFLLKTRKIFNISLQGILSKRYFSLFRVYLQPRNIPPVKIVFCLKK